MTYTLVFRVTREVWDAMEKGEKKTEYRDYKPFWTQRMERAKDAIRDRYGVQALFLCGQRKARYAVRHIHLWDQHSTRSWEQVYLHTETVWAVELGERIA